MPYTQFNSANPNGASQAGPAYSDAIRKNFQALRDAVLAGALYGWNYDVDNGTGTAEQPQYVYMKKAGGTEWLQQTLTYGSSGGGAGNVTQIVLKYSANSGGAYDTIGTLTITYDANGNVTDTLWS